MPMLQIENEDEDLFLRKALIAYEDDVQSHAQKQFCVGCCLFVWQRKCKKCEVCSVRYCSAECQRKDWPTHRSMCSVQA